MIGNAGSTSGLPGRMALDLIDLADHPGGELLRLAAVSKPHDLAAIVEAPIEEAFGILPRRRVVAEAEVPHDDDTYEADDRKEQAPARGRICCEWHRCARSSA